MSEIDSWIYIATAILVPLGFIVACIFVKPHKSHVWEHMQFMASSQQKDKK